MEEWSEPTEHDWKVFRIFPLNCTHGPSDMIPFLNYVLHDTESHCRIYIDPENTRNYQLIHKSDTREKF